MIKIQNGTPPSKNLCLSCTYFNKTEFQNGDIELFCDNYALRGDNEKRLSGLVAECSGFEAKGFVSLYSMEKIAYILDISNKKKIGFIKPKDWKDKHGDEDITPAK